MKSSGPQNIYYANGRTRAPLFLFELVWQHDDRAYNARVPTRHHRARRPAENSKCNHRGRFQLAPYHKIMAQVRDDTRRRGFLPLMRLQPLRKSTDETLQPLLAWTDIEASKCMPTTRHGVRLRMLQKGEIVVASKLAEYHCCFVTVPQDFPVTMVNPHQAVRSQRMRPNLEFQACE